MIAACKGHEACVRVLIAAKADLAYRDRIGWTALHNAAYFGHASLCRVLIDEGASLTDVYRYGQTPLELAKAPGNAECVAILEEAGAVLPPAVAAAYAFVDEHIASTRGFRFAVTKMADEQAPRGLGRQIFGAADKGKIDELLGLCQEWAGHAVIDAYKDEVSQDTNTNTNTNICLLAYSPNKQTTHCACVLIASRMAGIP